MDYKKIENLTEHILQECENRGFTISEVNFLLTNLPMKFGEAIHSQTGNLSFKVTDSH